MPYVATINVPGYLPMDNDPPVFDTPGAAWAYLADKRQLAEDDTEEDGPYSETWTELSRVALGLAPTVDDAHPGNWPTPHCGTIYGPTPGYAGDHDLGLAYSVTEVWPPCEDPHEPPDPRGWGKRDPLQERFGNG